MDLESKLESKQGFEQAIAQDTMDSPTTMPQMMLPQPKSLAESPKGGNPKLVDFRGLKHCLSDHIADGNGILLCDGDHATTIWYHNSCAPLFPTFLICQSSVWNVPHKDVMCISS